MGVVKKPVQYRRGGAGAAEQFPPLAEIQVRRHDEGAALIRLGNQLEPTFRTLNPRTTNFIRVVAGVAEYFANLPETLC